jgi:hypothetical protein
LEEQLRGELVGIVRDCQLELSRAYQQAHLPQIQTTYGESLPLSSPEAVIREEGRIPAPEQTVDISPYVVPPPTAEFSDNSLDMMWGSLPLSLNAFSDSGYASMERFDLDQNSSFNQYYPHEQNPDNLANPADSVVQEGKLAFQPMDSVLFEP